MMTQENETPRRQRDGWVIIRTIFTILTPLILAIGGFFVNQNISAIKNRVDKVERMVPLLDRLVEPDQTKVRLAAHAFYVLMREDPALVVRVLLSTRNKELVDLLRDLATSDPGIDAALKQVVPQREGRTALNLTQTPEEQSAVQIIHETTEQPTIGWLYVGKKYDDEWVDLTIELADPEPTKDKEYLVRQNTYLRKTQPKVPEYRLGDMIGVVKEGSKIKVLEVKAIESHELRDFYDLLDRIWARVQVESGSIRRRAK